MTHTPWFAAALMPIVFAAPAMAGQGRSSPTGGYGALSTARSTATRGDGAQVRPGVRTAEPAQPATSQRITVPQPSASPATTASSSPPVTVSPSAPVTPVRAERFSYPPPARSSGNGTASGRRADGARSAAAARNPSLSARSAAPAGSAVSSSPASRGYTGSGRAVARPTTRYDVPRLQGQAPRYVAPGWRSGSTSHVTVVPRHVRPRVLGFAPYRRYCYRPSLGIGIYYGVGGFYPFGEIDAEYYDPPSDAALGGVRITGAPSDAQVFVGGAYVGIVDDFDGPDQHLNLEPGVHRIEIHSRAAGAIAFDVTVQQGRTITLRAGVN